MRKSLNAIIFCLLIITSEIILGKETNKTSKIHKNNKKHNNHAKDNPNIERIKRSLDDEEDKQFWANRGKRSADNSPHKYSFDVEKAKYLKNDDDYSFGKVSHYGTRIRRDSSSAEDIDGSVDYDHVNCKNCYGTIHFDSDQNFKDRRDDALAPFWGNRGRRAGEIEDPDEPFWGNRGRRQEDEPFWGTRGRRTDSPLLGARGRQEEEPFWGNRGRREDVDPFWGNRGRGQDSEPFWGNRGRRQEEPFWGNRGRREDEPFWGNRGRRKESEPFWGNRGRRKEDLKESILDAFNVVENDIEHLSRLRRSDPIFWSNKGRDSKLKNMFTNPLRNRINPHSPMQLPREYNVDMKITDPGTVGDSRIYAEEPQYIVVERSGRSSAESEDPFYISRGKKHYLNYNLMKAARDRRGAIEEIVKSVRNDPYYIARGKKATKQNSTDEESKAKELICSAVELITHQNGLDGKAKREIMDSDRDRRTILKKLAAQLQNDPFPISRGKKSEDANLNLHEFITSIADQCD